MDDGVTQEEMNLTCFNLMIDVLNSQMELQVSQSHYRNIFIETLNAKTFPNAMIYGDRILII